MCLAYVIEKAPFYLKQNKCKPLKETTCIGRRPWEATSPSVIRLVAPARGYAIACFVNPASLCGNDELSGGGTAVFILLRKSREQAARCRRHWWSSNTRSPGYWLLGMWQNVFYLLWLDNEKQLWLCHLPAEELECEAQTPVLVLVSTLQDMGKRSQNSPQNVSEILPSGGQA